MLCPQPSTLVPVIIPWVPRLSSPAQCGVHLPTPYLPCQVEVGVVSQADGGCLAGLGLVVDGQLPASEGVGDPDFQVTRVAFLTVGAEPEEADAIWEHLGAPENLQGARS